MRSLANVHDRCLVTCHRMGFGALIAVRGSCMEAVRGSRVEAVWKLCICVDAFPCELARDLEACTNWANFASSAGSVQRKKS